MREEELLRHYERVADAPIAIARLRKLVLNLAIRGRLVGQDLNDGSALDLFARLVAANETRLRGSPKQIRAAQHTVADADLPFPVPPQWTFVRLGSVLEMTNGRAFKPTEWVAKGLPIVRIQNLNNAAASFNYCDPATIDVRHIIGHGEFLISWSGTPGTSFGAFIWSGGPAALNQHIFRCIQVGESYTPAFLRLAINSQLDVLVGQAQGGVGLQHVTKGTLESLPLPLPPIAEQHRIVAKVDELMALCDRLEAARAEREAARDRLAAASLARLNTPDPETFANDARFALDALPALTARPDQMKRLRQAIINLAVSGLLVPQDSAEGTGADLLAALMAARAEWEALGRIRKAKGCSTPVELEAADVSLPKSWSWARLVDLGQTQTGTSPSSSNADLFGSYMPFVKPADLDGPTVNCDGPGISELGVPHSRVAEADSVLMVCIGGTLGKVNRITRAVCFNQQINSVTPFLDGQSEFLEIVLKSSGFQALAWSRAGTGTLPIINKGKWEVLPVPVPPLSEQRRIVAKVQELLALCDQLEAGLSAGVEHRSRLLSALLGQALEPSSGANTTASVVEAAVA